MKNYSNEYVLKSRHHEGVIVIGTSPTGACSFYDLNRIDLRRGILLFENIDIILDAVLSKELPSDIFEDFTPATIEELGISLEGHNVAHLNA